MINFGGGQLPSFGQRPQMGGQQQSVAQMWQPQMHTMQQPTGQLPPMGQGPQMQPMGQQVPGMVHGVPGSMGLNPGAGGPIQGQQQMNGNRAGGLQWQPQGNQPGHGQGFGQFAQSGPFQSMLQSPEAQQFLQGNPQYQRFLSRGQQGGGPIMRPMGA